MKITRGKHKFKTLIMLCIMTIMMSVSTITALAYGRPEEVFSAYGFGSSEQKSAVTSFLHTTSSDAYNTPVQCPDGNTYYYDSSKTDAIVAAGNGISSQSAKASEGQAAVQEYSNNIGDLGLQADVGTATGMLSGFMGVLRTMLGVIVVFISVGMTVFSAFDLAYIAFPVFRNKCEDAKQNGGMMAKKSSNGEAKLRFISDDAQYAVVAADTTQSGKNPFIIYFGKRLISYLVLAILLFILLTGRVTVFTDIAIRLVSGFINVIQSI